MELENYYQTKLEYSNHENDNIDNIYGILKAISNLFIPIFISELIQFVIKPEDSILVFCIVGFITTISLFLKMIIWLINEFRLENDDTYLNLLIPLIRERRIEIINSRNNNIFNKILYTLKLGKYS